MRLSRVLVRGRLSTNAVLRSLAWRSLSTNAAAASASSIPDSLRGSLLQPPSSGASATAASDMASLASSVGGIGAVDGEAQAVYAPAIKVRFADEQGRMYVTGKKKRAIARVWLSRGSGAFTVNGKQLSDYFCSSEGRDNTLAAFSLTRTHGMFDVECTVKGGGIVGQSHAVRHGVSTALRYMEPSLRPLLKKAGFLTRDPRIVERKKPGLKKARKAKQWVKR